MDIPSLIKDLAIMLITAGIVSILFKKIKLPAILGYILAGFLMSPYFPLFMNVQDQEAIETLSELGVIVMLFHIGLEFDFHKLMNLGSTAIVTAVVKMGGVMAVGYLFGSLIGLSDINCVFLGAMLSISSTVVIQKCFEELGVMGEKYTSLVMGTLVMEDVLSVFIMVILPTIAVSQNINGSELALNFGMMGVYLVAWLLAGIFLLPTILNRIMPLMNREMTVAFSLGLCFVMALLADRLGFSTELGAFLTGMFFGGTVHAEKIEESTAGVKDMFSVIFFMSVGMMVDPQVILDRWTSIVPIAIIAVLAKLVFATIGMLLSGQSLSTAVKSGFSLAPIGEFSFIIASLGISLGVMDGYLYPAIVAASILTTLLAPTLIRSSDKAVSLLKRILPDRLVQKLEQYTSDDPDSGAGDENWGTYIAQYFRSFLIYGVIMIVASIAALQFLHPALAAMMPDLYARILTLVFIYLVIALFLLPMLQLHNTAFTHLWIARRFNRPPLVVMTIFKLAVVAFLAFLPLNSLFHVHSLLLFGVILLGIFILSRTDLVSTMYLQVETRFLRNLNEKTIDAVQQKEGKVEWLNEDLHIISFFIREDSGVEGQTLTKLRWGQMYNVLAVKIRRGERHILLPSGTVRVHRGDKVFVVGDPHALANFRKVLHIPPETKDRTLRQFMESDYADTEHALACLAIQTTGNEPYIGQAIMNSKILARAHCMILGIQKNGLTITMPDPHLLISKGDILWVMGSNNNVGRLAGYSS